MSKISVNIPEDEKDRLDSFIEKSASYGNRSAFIREAVERNIENDYEFLKGIAGSWSKETADKVRARINALDEEDLEAQRMEA